MSVAEYALAAMFSCRDCPDKDDCDVVLGETCDRIEALIEKARKDGLFDDAT